MAFDIYGGRLAPGHCEVHPHIPEPYPCHACMARQTEPQPTQPRPKGPPCDICGDNPSVATQNGYGVCSQGCAIEASRRPADPETPDEEER